MDDRKSFVFGRVGLEEPAHSCASKYAKWQGEDFLSVFNGKKWWLRFLELKDPGTVLELIAVMELSVVRGAVEPHFVDDFEPAVG